MKKYKIKELFYTLQGEGAQTGRPAVFCRFTGCNLWSGREEDRSTAICQFCDTEFRGTDGQNGGRYTAKELALKAKELWPKNSTQKLYVVCTGGEPLLQLDEMLVDAFHEQNFEVAIETNGTIAAPTNVDWICMSPKEGSEIILKSGDELKLVYPQINLPPSLFELYDFDYFYLQAMDGDKQQENLGACLKYCLAHPQWRLSLQTHKILDID